MKWVEMGAPDPRDGKSAEVAKAQVDIDAGRKFRSFRPLSEASPPPMKNSEWVRTNVDRFIAAKLQAEGLTPNSDADRRTLIRRLYFDLWGLPPDPGDVKAFVQDDSPDAYEQLVDRLLEGEHFGERWARHWLDLARFAESNGYAFDKDRPAAFHYRDFVNSGVLIQTCRTTSLSGCKSQVIRLPRRTTWHRPRPGFSQPGHSPRSRRKRSESGVVTSN